MRIAIDTSAYSALRREHRAVAEHLNHCDLVVISPIVIAELMTGFRGGNRERENRDLLDMFCGEPSSLVVSIERETAELFSEIQQHLKRSGTPVPTNDVWIAASAMQHGCRLLTTDAHFQRIPQIFTVHVPVN